MIVPKWNFFFTMNMVHTVSKNEYHHSS